MIKLEIVPANENDSKFFYDCRNYHAARESSRNKDEIPYENHQQWYSKALADPKRHLYVALHSGNKVGNLRFDEETNNHVEISVAVNPEMYGKGYGTEVIVQGSKKFFEDSHNTEVIRAEVFPDNPPSIKVFEKAGYTKKGTTSEDLLEFWLTRK
jgi:RimJ/RimL family protein N-acetyltransferase